MWPGNESYPTLPRWEISRSSQKANKIASLLLISNFIEPHVGREKRDSLVSKGNILSELLLVVIKYLRGNIHEACIPRYKNCLLKKLEKTDLSKVEGYEALAK